MMPDYYKIVIYHSSTGYLLDSTPEDYMGPYGDAKVAKILGMQLFDYRYELTRKFNAKKNKHGDIVFDKSEDALIALDWANSILIMNKLVQ